MNKLKKKIIRYFLICTLGILIAESAADILFDLVMEKAVMPKYVQNPESASAMIAVSGAAMVSLIVSLLIWLAGALVFYRLVRKAVEEESRRRAAEQNMLYSCIAHDLKTPMTSVQGFAAALRDGRVRQEEQGEICDIIYRKTKHMNELVETLSAYSKLGTEDFALNLQPVNVCTLVRDTAAMHYSDFEGKAMELVIDIPEEPLCSLLDKKEFTRAISNIMVNACKHNESGCQVLIGVHAEGQSVLITIADTGLPIPEELVPALFDPFVCGNSSRTSGTGSGLGLAVSYRIVQRHGATLSYVTDVEGYSKGFVFRLDRK